MRNQFEKDIHTQLVRRFGKGNVEYEPVKFHYTTKHIYTPDFRVRTNSDGDLRPYEWFVESKGYFRQEDMRNLRAVRECNPELDLRIIFQRDSKYRKTMTYSDWAKRYNFPHAIAKVPKEWSN